jgi:hypothetical protein
VRIVVPRNLLLRAQRFLIYGAASSSCGLAGAVVVIQFAVEFAADFGGLGQELGGGAINLYAPLCCALACGARNFFVLILFAALKGRSSTKHRKDFRIF